MLLLWNSIFLLTFLSTLSIATESNQGRHGGHTHHIPDKDGPKNVLRDNKYLRDYEHIKEDLQEFYNKDFAGELDELEMEIYYFQLHDLNGDKKLDGLELLAAMNHIMDRTQAAHESFSKEDLEKHPNVRQSLQTWWNDKFEEDSKYIDEILKEEDQDQDGFLTYLEFAIGRQKERQKIGT
ncbi:multiple coagulation factor deficiency protein 2 homolog [Parasteatoda tepidariorum]|uniref:multiple coagulation factor deficiency protein 2 homolog n=1 Tax=Parasteatoda tepidariorum TaxID=114398 RepID=UPI00077FD43F|nr:multiple coagulation factor deficiency protein 2 homolog [Parasteatoda tepidariorum]